MKWTEADEQHLLARKAEGATNAEIAGEMGKTPTSIKSKLERLRYAASLLPKQWTEAEDQRIIELRRRQSSYTEIAKEIKRTKAEVIERCEILGCTLKTGSMTQDEIDYILKRHAEGADTKTIAKEIGRSTSAVFKRIDKNPKAKAPETPKVFGTKKTEITTEELIKLSDGRLTEDVRTTYQQVLTQASTVEMVLYTLYKIPKQLRPLTIEDAAIKLVRLIGHGPEYFHARREWRIQDWIKHLANLTEGDMP